MEAPGKDMTEMMWKMLSATLVVLLLGGLSIFVIKRLLPKISRVAGKKVSVLETVYLGPRKAVHLIQVGSRKLLVGSSTDRIVKLDDVTDAVNESYDDVALRVQDEAKSDDDGGSTIDEAGAS